MDRNGGGGALLTMRLGLFTLMWVRACLGLAPHQGYGYSVRLYVLVKHALYSTLQKFFASENDAR